ncbi:hypothetical protein BU17DRAFT_85896 [Hysterangium stoloniferum]|nr:hypothetical protein BU17DRAFT_85896 [Hysterangium stoloniferum]
MSSFSFSNDFLELNLMESPLSCLTSVWASIPSHTNTQSSETDSQSLTVPDIPMGTSSAEELAGGGGSFHPSLKTNHPPSLTADIGSSRAHLFHQNDMDIINPWNESQTQQTQQATHVVEAVPKDTEIHGRHSNPWNESQAQQSLQADSQQQVIGAATMANAQMSKTTRKQQDVEMDESDRPSHDACTKLRIIEVDRSLELCSIAWNEKCACKHNFKRSKDMHNKLHAMEETYRASSTRDLNIQEKLREEAEAHKRCELALQEVQKQYEAWLAMQSANTQMEMATLVQQNGRILEDQREKYPQPPSLCSQKLKHHGISTRMRLICTPIEEDISPDPNPVEPFQSSVPSSDQMDNADEKMVRLMETAIKHVLFQKNGGHTKMGKIGGKLGAQVENIRMKAKVSSTEHRVSLTAVHALYKHVFDVQQDEDFIAHQTAPAEQTPWNTEVIEILLTKLKEMDVKENWGLPDKDDYLKTLFRVKYKWARPSWIDAQPRLMEMNVQETLDEVDNHVMTKKDVALRYARKKKRHVDVSPDILQVSPDILQVSPDILQVSPDILQVSPDILQVSPETCPSDEGDNADGPDTESRVMVTTLMAPIERESDEGDGGDLSSPITFPPSTILLEVCTSKKSSQDTTLSPPVLGLDVLVGVLYRYQFHIALHLVPSSWVKWSNETICTCTECLEQGGLHISHINHPSPATQAPCDFTAQANEELSPEQEEDMHCEGARHLLTLVLSDPQPDAEDQPPHHWTSLDDYQESRGVNNHLPNVLKNLPMDDIIVGVCQLFIQRDPQHPSSLPSDTEETNDPHRPTDPCVGVISSPDHSFHSFRADRIVTLQEPVRRAPPRRTDLPTVDENSWSIKALIILSNIEYCVALCSYKLATLPLEITLLEAQSEVATLHSALEQVDRCTTFILQRKQEITEQLDKLEDHVEAEKPPPEPSNDPVYVDCAHHYDIPVNRMTDIAQVSVFLGVVCSIIIGVSCQAGQKLMG